MLRIALFALSLSMAMALVPSSLSVRATRAAVVRMDASEDDPFNMDLLKLPRLTTPQRQAFEKYRERQAQRTGRAPTSLDDMAKNGPGKTPLGTDPVEGEPVDLAALYAEHQEFAEPTAEQAAEAEADYRRMVGDDDGGPDGFGEGIDKFI